MEQKKCRICGETKPATADNYYVNGKYAGGFAHECKICFRELAKERHASPNRRSRGSNEEDLPTERSQSINLGNGVVRVIFGLKYKPGSGQTHGMPRGYASALANNMEGT